MTNKQRVFIEEYLRCWNATEAARLAGFSHPNKQGPRLLVNVGIKSEIERRIEEKQMSADEALQGIADIARGDMGEFLDIGSMAFQVDLDKAKELGLTKLIKKVKMRTTTATTLSKEGVQTETETSDIEIELYDKLSALVSIGRHHALFTDKSDITSGGKPLDFSRMTDEQLAQLAKGDDPATVISG